MSYSEAIKRTPFISLFVRNAGKIAFVSGIIGSVLLALNRSWLHGTPVTDNMSLSGIALILCSLAMLPADRWPNGEPLFAPLVFFLSVENLSIALTDNRIRRYFGMDAAAVEDAPIA